MIFEQKIIFDNVPGDDEIARITCYLIHHDYTDVTGFGINKEYLHTDVMWRTIALSFNMLKRTYDYRMSLTPEELEKLKQND